MSKKRSSQPLLRAFGRYLEDLRGKGKSRQQVANRLRDLGAPLGQSTLAQYERGSVWAPDAAVLRALSRVYLVSFDQLVDVLATNRREPDRTDYRDLIRHGRTGASGLSEEAGLVQSAATRLRELEDRVASYRTLVRKMRERIREVIDAPEFGEEGPQTPRITPGRRRHG